MIKLYLLIVIFFITTNLTEAKRQNNQDQIFINDNLKTQQQLEVDQQKEKTPEVQLMTPYLTKPDDHETVTLLPLLYGQQGEEIEEETISEQKSKPGVDFSSIFKTNEDFVLQQPQDQENEGETLLSPEDINEKIRETMLPIPYSSNLYRLNAKTVNNRKEQKLAHLNSQFSWSFQAPSIEENLRLLPSGTKQETNLMDLIEHRTPIVSTSSSKNQALKFRGTDSTIQFQEETTLRSLPDKSGAIIFPDFNLNKNPHKSLCESDVTKPSVTSSTFQPLEDTTLKEIPTTVKTTATNVTVDNRILFDTTSNCKSDEIFIHNRCHKQA